MVYRLLDRFGPSLEDCLLPLAGFDLRLVGQQVRRMMQPRHWKVQEIVMNILVSEAWMAEGNRRRRRETEREAESSEGTEWDSEDDEPFMTGAEQSKFPCSPEGSLCL